MPTFDLDHWDPASHEEERAFEEISDERFDRLAFAHDLLERVRPRHMTIALCRGRSRIVVEAGRVWGKGEKERWAMISVPPTASRQAIALALAGLADDVARA